MSCPGCGAPNPDDAPACHECGRPFAAVPPLGPGFELAGRYEIVRLLGKGGMGMVYEARDRLLEEVVAIKVLRPEAAASPEVAQRFRAEIKLARAVSHKNVCRIHEYGEDRGIRYISMAYVDGIDLKQVLRRRGPLPPAEAFEAAIKVAHALQAIHDEGIVHRDLKTPNIMIDGRGVVRLMDFGIAKQEQGDGLSMTVTGQIIGTPEYMSPEQVQAHRLDGRSDLYSLGVVVFELFTGVTPFRADTPLGTVLKHLNEPPPLSGPPATLIPEAVVPVLRKALAKAREDRYASAREMAEALEAARAATPAATSPLAATATATGSDDEETLAATLRPAVTLEPATTTLAGARSPAAPVPTGPAAGEDSRTPRVGHARGAGAGLAGGLVAVAVISAVLGMLWRSRAPQSTEEGARSPASVASSPAGSLATPDAAASHAGPLDSASLASPAGAAVAAEPPGAAPSPRARGGSSPSAATAVQKTPPAAADASTAARSNGPAAPVPSTQPPLPVGAAADPAAEALAQRVEKLLAEGAAALETQAYDAAIACYDEALRLDPRSALARMGRVTALSARASAASSRAPAAASFVAGKTVAESAETRPDAALQAAFEDTPGVEVTRDTQPAQLPGRIEFRTEPASVGPGEVYKLEVRFVNAGRAAIDIRELVVTTTVNGRRASGPVSPAVSTVAPGQAARVLSLDDMLRADLESWSLEVVLRTSRGETYRNRLAWSPAGAASAR